MQEFYNLLDKQISIEDSAIEKQAYLQYLNQYFEKKTDNIGYWSTYFTAPETLASNRLTAFEYEKGQLSFVCPSHIVTALIAAAKKHSVTFSSCIYYVWAEMLITLFHQKEAWFGITLSGRANGTEHIDSIVGMFIQNVPFFVSKNITESPPFKIIKHFLYRIIEHQENIPCLYSYLHEQNYSLANIYQSVVTIQNYPNHFAQKAKRTQLLVHRTYMNTVPLLLAVRFYNGKVFFDFSYNKRKYSSDTVRQIYQYLYTSILHLTDL